MDRDRFESALDRLIAAQNDMRYLPSPRALLESALIHICRPEDALTLTNLEARLDRLEAQLRDGVPARERPAPAPKPEPKPAPKAKPKPEPEPESGPAPRAEDEPPELPPPEDGDAFLPPPDEPEPEPMPQRKPAPVPKAADASDAAAIWRETIANIPNMFVQALAREAAAIRFEQNTLTVGFTDAQETKHKSLSAPINFEPAQRALQAVRPGAKLVITTARGAPASGQAEELAKALFGDKLTIE